MTQPAQRYARLHALFAEARELPPAGRDAFLAERCADDDELRDELSAMLAVDGDEGDDGSDLLSETRIQAGREALEEAVDDRSRDPAAEWSPERVGGYRVVRRLGAGGMGVVYEAEQATPRRRVALKLVHPYVTDERTRRRFLSEADILASLSHAGIASVYESGVDDLGHGPQPWFAMELVEGRDLATHADARGLDARARLELLAAVADAVQHAHERGIVHRDLKPDNVLVDGRGQPKVLDFGVAHVTDAAARITAMTTASGVLMGTLAYMAPEQVDGEVGAVGPWSDVYALGVVGYELLAGRRPFDVAGLSLSQAVAAITGGEMTPLCRVAPDVPRDAETILGVALAPDLPDRYPSAAALADDIRRSLADRPIVARAPSALDRARRFARRNRVLVGGVAATMLALALGLVVALALAESEREQRQLATAAADRAERRRVQLTGQLLDSARERLAAGRSWEAGELLSSVDDDLKGWPWQLLARVAPRLLPPTDWHPRWYDDQHVLHVTAEGSSLYDARTLVKRAEVPIPGGSVGVDVTMLWDRPEVDSRSWRLHAFGELSWETGAVDIAYRVPEALRPRFEKVTDVYRPSLDGHLTAYDHEGETLTRWDDGEARWEVPATEGRLWLAPGDERLLVIRDDGATVRDTDTGEIVGVLPAVFPSVKRAVFSPDGRRAYTEYGARLRCIDMADAAWLPLPEIDMRGTDEFALSPDGTVVAYAAPPGIAYLVDLATGEAVSSFEFGFAGDDRQLVPDFSPDGSQLLLAAKQRGTLLVDLPYEPVGPEALGTDEDPRVLTYRGHDTYVYHLALSPDGRLAATLATPEKRILLWDLDTGETLAALPRTAIGNPGLQREQLMTFSADGRWLWAATGYADSQGLKLVGWDLLTGEVVVDPHPGVTWDGQAALVGPLLERLGPAFVGRLGNFAHRSAPGARASITFEDRPMMKDQTTETDDWVGLLTDVRALRGLAISTDGSRVAISDWSSTRVFAPDRVGRQQELATMFTVGYGLAYSPDGAWLAQGDVDGRVWIHDGEQHTLMLDFPAHDDYVFGLAWSVVGPRLVTTSGDRTVRVWDARHVETRRDDMAARAERLAALRVLDDAALRRRFADDPSTEARGAIVRVLLERR